MMYSETLFLTLIALIFVFKVLQYTLRLILEISRYLANNNFMLILINSIYIEYIKPIMLHDSDNYINEVSQSFNCEQIN